MGSEMCIRDRSVVCPRPARALEGEQSAGRDGAVRVGGIGVERRWVLAGCAAEFASRASDRRGLHAAALPSSLQTKDVMMRWTLA